MNDVLNNSVVYLEKEELNELLSEVKETVALNTNVNTAKANHFTTADLWSIHKKYKSSIPRRIIWN